MPQKARAGRREDESSSSNGTVLYSQRQQSVQSSAPAQRSTLPPGRAAPVRPAPANADVMINFQRTPVHSRVAVTFLRARNHGHGQNKGGDHSQVPTHRALPKMVLDRYSCLRNHSASRLKRVQVSTPPAAVSRPLLWRVGCRVRSLRSDTSPKSPRSV
jgi:hypothetical protein